MCNYCSVVAGGNFRMNGMTEAGVPVIVTYAFAPQAGLSADFRAADAELKAGVRQAAAHIESVAGIAMVEVDPGADAMVTIAYNTATSGVSWANYPSVVAGNAATSGGVAMSQAFAGFAPGSYGYEILLHEFGHTLGLKHPFDGTPRLPAALDTTAHTLMSYTSVGGPKSAYQDLDRQALAALYGPPDALEGVAIGYAHGTDVLSVAGTGSADVLIGVNGRNLVDGGLGPDSLFGRDAGDTLRGGVGGDRIHGEGGSDRLLGGRQRDRLWGDDGADTVCGGPGRDALWGGAGGDRLRGGEGADVVRGEMGNDRLFGGGGDDRLVGGAGADWIAGGLGRDVLVGGFGVDTLVGGAGADRFCVQRRGGDDVVLDFRPEEGDVLDLRPLGLSTDEALARLSPAPQDDGALLDSGFGIVRLAGVTVFSVSADDLLV